MKLSLSQARRPPPSTPHLPRPPPISHPFLSVEDAPRAVQEKLIGLSGAALAGLLLCGLALHVVYLLLNFGAATALRLPLEMKKAVVIMCSQKVRARLCAVSRRRASPGQAGPLGSAAD